MINIDLNNIENLFPKSYQLYKYSGYDNYTEFFDNKGLYIRIIPEFYKDGINWNLQILWYKEIVDDNQLIDGTKLYGDNNEFPKRKYAETAAHMLGFELMERKLNGKNMLPNFLDEINKDTLKFHEYFTS